MVKNPDGKESICSVGKLGWTLGLGRSPREGNGYPLQYSHLENSMDRGAWRAIVSEITESDTTEQLTQTLALSQRESVHVQITK